MKKFFTLMVTALVALAANATVKVTGPENGILSISTDSQGELSSFDLSSLTDEQKACTSVKLIGKFSQGDLEKLAENFNLIEMDASEVTQFNGTSGAYFLGNDTRFSSLKTFTYPKYYTTINVGWFGGSNIENIIVPDGVGNGEAVTVVGGGSNRSSLKSVYIGKGVTSIANSAFSGDKAIEKIVFAPGVKTIGMNAFQYCPAKNIVLPEGLVSIGNNAFNGAEVFSLRLPTTLKTIGANAFEECNNLTSVVIPQNVEFIGPQAFKGKNLSDVYVLGTNTKAAQNAFDPQNTYSGMRYTEDGEVDRTDWTGLNGCHPAVLHYPEAARDKYLNGIILDKDRFSGYYREGIDWPITGDNFNSYNNLNEDYRGWQEFMLTDILEPEEEFIVPGILDDTWYTMCFPFDLTLSQLYTAFGDFTEVCEFVKAEVKGEETKSIDFQFKRWVGDGKSANDIVTYANKPYMIHPNLGVKSGETISRRIVIAGINKLETEDQTPWTSENYKRGEDGDYIFVGNYKEQSIPQYAYFLGCKNGVVTFIKKLAACNQDSKKSRWNPFTAIIMTGAEFEDATSFWTCEDDGVSESSMIITAFSKINEDEQEEATGISDIQNEEKAQTTNENIVRNINGMVVRRGTTSLEGLPKGLYIVNGKKFIVR